MGSQSPAAPWDAVPAHEQLFVMITGSNSGIGLGIGERLIDDFLATRSLNAHLILLPTTRSASKSLQTIRALRSYAAKAAQTSSALRSRAGDAYRWEDTLARVHVVSPQLDLCDLKGVHAFARTLVGGTVSNPEGDEQELKAVRIPRLDSIVCNAAYGGWSGVNYPKAVWTILRDGLVQSATWPTFKMALPTCILNERPAYNYPPKPLLGEVFTACLFGHYILAHHLLPLLTRPASSPLPPSRIIFSSSLEAVRDVFSPSDIQCFSGPGPYESAKRLTDILSLTATLPATAPYTSRFLAVSPDVQPPKLYVSHPGIVASTLMPFPWWLMWAYQLVVLFSRMLGSPWHNADAYIGATSAVWLALQDQPRLDSLAATRIKWGSGSDRAGRVAVKPTEVEGWGWEGRLEDPKADTSAEGVFRKAFGRKRGAVDVREEDIAGFEELGAQCWRAMEELREEWEEILGIEDE